MVKGYVVGKREKERSRVDKLGGVNGMLKMRGCGWEVREREKEKRRERGEKKNEVVEDEDPLYTTRQLRTVCMSFMSFIQVMNPLYH